MGPRSLKRQCEKERERGRADEPACAVGDDPVLLRPFSAAVPTFRTMSGKRRTRIEEKVEEREGRMEGKKEGSLCG